MLKLIRRYFAYHQLYYKDEQLKWELLKNLAEKQDNDNFELGNKLSRKHINFQEAPMNVLLAVQTISNSVADTIEQLCEDGYEGFTGAETLVKFLRIYNNAYDIMNYGNDKPSDDNFKKPLCAENIQKFRDFFQEFREFTSQISIDEYKRKPKEKGNRSSNENKTTSIRKPILKSRSSMGFFGFLHNITSTLGIYNDYVEHGPLDVFYTFQYSQDHLETYFSLIRSSLGWNNNPNDIQFEAAYRKLLVCMPYTSARKGNCIIGSTNILNVSSAQQPAQHSESIQTIGSSVRELEIDELSLYDLLNREIEPYEEHMHAFIASTVETNIIEWISKRSKSACQCCLYVFNQNSKIYDSFIAKKNETKPIAQPCRSTVDIIKVCNVVLELLQPHTHVPFNIVGKTIFNHLDIDELYESEEFKNHLNPGCNHTVPGMSHKEHFIYNVMSEYLNLKSKKIGKRITIEEQNGRAIRRNLTRSIILAGQ